MRIGIDAMGGDHAPAVVIEGVVQALKETDIEVVLIGPEERVKEEFKRHNYPTDRVTFCHAPDVIGMDERATVSVRKKRNSSITIGIRQLKDRSIDAFLSAGNTGAVVAASSLFLGLLDGVERPAIGLFVPTLKNFSFLIDVGANTEPKSKHLVQSALMASVYIRAMHGIENPSVGLLNIGEEAGKGSHFEKETYRLMNETLSNFTGNVEANELYKGMADCVVCDGFVGNVVIKTSVGLLESAGKLIKREMKKSPVALLGAWLMRKSLRNVVKLADYSEYGGAPLLGVNGVVVICHGRSSAKAIKNAIKVTHHEVSKDILSRLTNTLTSN